jgi:hypothetical protein
MSRSMSRTFLHPEAQVLNAATWASKTSETTDPGLQSESNISPHFARHPTFGSDYQYSSDISSAHQYFSHPPVESQFGIIYEQLGNISELQDSINLRQTLLQLSAFIRAIAGSLGVDEVDKSFLDYSTQLEFQDPGNQIVFTFHLT